jgi:hypothetical protein
LNNSNPDKPRDPVEDVCREDREIDQHRHSVGLALLADTKGAKKESRRMMVVQVAKVS